MEKNDSTFTTDDFLRFIKRVRVKEEKLSDQEFDQICNNIEKRNHLHVNRWYRRKVVLFSVAASIAVLFILSTTIYFNQRVEHTPDLTEIASIAKPEKSSEQIQLILQDRKPIAIENHANIQYSKKGQILVNTEAIQESEPEAQTEPEYNQLVVPMGKRSTLTLSDGTKLWVNAGTRVIYPVNFMKSLREIYVDGEVFLEVHHNKNWPFIVKTNGMNIKVLGTSFNITAYEDEETQAVVLISGSVKVETQSKQVAILKPDEMFSLDHGVGNIEKVDVTDYILWKDGLYKFRSQRLDAILAKLSRYYGQQIICDSESAALVCNGKLDLKENLERLLKGLAQTIPVQWSYKEGVYKLRITTKTELPMK